MSRRTRSGRVREPRTCIDEVSGTMMGAPVVGVFGSEEEEEKGLREEKTTKNEFDRLH